MEEYKDNFEVFLFLMQIGIAFFVVCMIIGHYREIYHFLTRTSRKGRKPGKSNKNTFKS